MNGKRTVRAERRSAGALAASAVRGLFLGVELAVFACFVEVIDSFSNGCADLLFEEET